MVRASSVAWWSACTIAALSPAAGCGAQPQRHVDEEAQLVISPLAADAGAALEAPLAPAEEAHSSSLVIPARDPRVAKRRPRSRALVLTEVQALEQLLNATPAGAVDRPVLERRIAESYNELAATSSGPDAARAREGSIKYYAAIAANSPQYPQLDEALYYLGLAYELNGNLASARRAYYDVIQKTPSSNLVPLAYFAFGEMFFLEAESDATKNELAKQAFLEVIKRHTPQDTVLADALLRLGQTYVRLNDDAKAKAAFERLRRDFATSDAAAQIPRGH
jgi:TolA-binding protein